MTPVQTLPGGDPTTFHSTCERFDTLLTFAGSAEAQALTCRLGSRGRVPRA
ncbi:hypothetical protein [Sulfobacillus sp. hq2]|uniref:hypothetical protein n=1 Tax=Sulfobacillus TaxID=28033 RepID=UPI001304870E|nr:hypothetical protein [Sulfobacillus sp. hq2]